MQIAEVVISKKGKYDGEMFFVIAVENGCALVADGKIRKMSNPKRKNINHLEETGLFSPQVAEGVKKGANTTDALMRAELRRLKLMFKSKVSD